MLDIAHSLSTPTRALIEDNMELRRSMQIEAWKVISVETNVLHSTSRVLFLFHRKKMFLWEGANEWIEKLAFIRDSLEHDPKQRSATFYCAEEISLFVGSRTSWIQNLHVSKRKGNNIYRPTDHLVLSFIIGKYHQKKKKKNRCQATCKYGWRFTLVPRRHASKKNLLLPADTACRRCTHFPGHIKDCMSNLCFTTAWVDYQFIFEDPMWARLVQHAFSCSWAIVFFINHRWASQALELVNHWMNDNGRNSSKAKLFWSRSAKVRVDSCIW